MTRDVLDQRLGELDETRSLDLADHLVGDARAHSESLPDFGPKFEAGVTRLLGKRLHLLCDDREAPTGLARAGGLDRGVEREEVGACGDLLARAGESVDLVAKDGQQGSDPAWHGPDSYGLLVKGAWSISAVQQ